jgi:hypothetical protein
LSGDGPGGQIGKSRLILDDDAAINPPSSAVRSAHPRTDAP